MCLKKKSEKKLFALLDKNDILIFRFLTVFLKKKIYTMGNSLLDFIILEDLNSLVNEFNLTENVSLSFLDKTMDAYLNSYSDSKFIFFIEIKDLRRFFDSNKTLAYNTLIPNKCFLCFDIINPKRNLFYGVYKEDKWKLYGEQIFRLKIEEKYISDERISFKEIGITDIEDRFGAKNLIKAVDKLPENGFTSVYRLFKTIEKITNDFSKGVIADEIITFTLMLNDIKFCSTEEKTKDFHERASIFRKYGTKLRANSAKSIEKIREQYSLILQNPDNYVVGQSYRLLPKDDLPRLSKLLQNPFGLVLLFYVDRIFLKISNAGELMNLIVIDFVFYRQKMLSLMDLRSSILQEISNFIDS